MATFAEQMVQKYQTALLSMPVGVKSTTIDGVAVTYDDLASQLKQWEMRAAIESGSRPRVATIRLDRF